MCVYIHTHTSESTTLSLIILIIFQKSPGRRNVTNK